MAITKPEIDELRLAWKRILRDRPDRIFVTHPHVCDWLENDLDDWLKLVANHIENGFTAQAACPCPAPKPGFLIRPGSVLALEDELVYAFVVSKIFPSIHKLLSPNQGSPDIAYIFSTTPNAKAWIRSDWKVWARWRKDSIAALEDSEFVLTTDIVGYYDNIELSILSSDLKSICGNDEHVSFLMDCLNRWSQPRGRGIPQGYSASHVLAKLYLYSLDQHLCDLDYRHLRYVDDIRVFCTTKLEVQKAIIDIGKFLSKRGLNLQGAKTKILNKSEAILDFDGVANTIEKLQAELKTEIEEMLGNSGDYLSEPDLLKALENSGDPPVEMLEKAFEENFVEEKFNKTLFHYLLTRLGKARSKAAVEYGMELLITRPDETGPILQYLNAVELSETQIQSIARYFLSETCIYDYQKYQFMRWCSVQTSCHNTFLSIARQWAFDGSLPEWVRSFAISVLGTKGIGHDLEVIEARYDEQTSETLRADCVFACRSQEKGRRNTFYAKAENDGYLVKLAIKAAKTAT